MHPLTGKFKAVLFALAATFLLSNVGFAMEAGAFQRLLQSIDNAYMSDRLLIIQTAASSNTFNSDQAQQLLNTLSFSSEQLEALETLASRLEDPQNAFVILDVFVFSSDREAASALLAKATPAKTSRVAVVSVYARLSLLSVYVRDQATFEQLLASVQATSYDGDKIAIIERAAREPEGFAAQQVAALLETVGFSGDRLAMLTLLAPKIIDLSGRESTFVLEPFPSDENKLAALGLIKHTLRRANDLSEVGSVFRFEPNRGQAELLLSSLR